MSQQPQVTTISDPVAPNGDAPYVSATTSTKGFVFKPGAVYPNGGPVQQNEYNTAGLPLLSSLLKGEGLFPVIPLRSSLVQLDFSVVLGNFNVAADIDFGSNCSLEGLTAQPHLLMGAHQLTTAPVGLQNVLITATGAGPFFGTAPLLLALTGQSGLSGALAYTVPTGFTSEVRIADRSILGDFTTPVIHVANGAALNIYVKDLATLTANAFTIAGTGTVLITATPSAFIDPSYYTMAGVMVVFTAAPTNLLTYAPALTNSATVFTDFGQLCAYMAAVGTLVPEWTILCSPEGGGTPNIPAGTYALPQIITIGSTAITGASTVTLSDGVVFDPPPLYLTIDDIALESANTAAPTMTLGNDMYLVIKGRFSLLFNGNIQPVISVVGGVSLTADMYGQAQLSNGGVGATIAVDAASNATIGAYDQSRLTAIGIFNIAVGGTVTIDISAETDIDPSYAFVAGLTIVFKAKAEQIEYTPTVLANWSGTAPASVADALDRIAAKITPIP